MRKGPARSQPGSAKPTHKKRPGRNRTKASTAPSLLIRHRRAATSNSVAPKATKEHPERHDRIDPQGIERSGKPANPGEDKRMLPLAGDIRDGEGHSDYLRETSEEVQHRCPPDLIHAGTWLTPFPATGKGDERAGHTNTASQMPVRLAVRRGPP